MSLFGAAYWRSFVGAFALIAVVCTAIVSLAVVLAGKETATILGSTLAVLFSSVLARIESRGPLKNDEPQAPSTPSAKPISGLWYFLTLTLAIFAIQALMILALVGAFILLNWPSDGFQDGWLGVVALVALVALVEKMLSPTFLVGIVAANCLAYFLGGFLCGKTASNVRYAHAAFSSLAVTAINSAPALGIVVAFDWSAALSFAMPFSLFALLYVGMALAGTRAGSKRLISDAFPYGKDGRNRRNFGDLSR